MNIQQIKQRFGIIGSSPLLERALDIATQVANTDLSVLISGESGTGKEVFPQIIHQLSARKHAKYIAVNCGAIPEGTMDSELFGHEKGSFTGAHESRKGYFEVADGGTIFLDEVAELPLQTQVRLLRVLESGEFLRVGSSKVFKTDVRIVAATNVDVPQAIEKGKFREDLYYRLNTVPITVPPLRRRKEDIYIIFRKFAADFAEKYRMPVVKLTPEAKSLLENFRWPGNVRQLKNVTEQISVIESEKEIGKEVLLRYLPEITKTQLPILYHGAEESGLSEREILYKILFDLKRDVNELKKFVHEGGAPPKHESEMYVSGNLPMVQSKGDFETRIDKREPIVSHDSHDETEEIDESSVVMEESLSLAETEKHLIKKALSKHSGKRKRAADELGISERTLYRKIKEYDIA
ncbi:MAG TPA: sigma-54-dependent Fis family transcriptional regulator [Flavobacteriales bacterium]|nr:sigma-54-dependent Fis family transcriptional regulator [Flavobacteriales bacterium]